MTQRALVENLRSTSFKVVTGLLLLASIAVVVLPQLLGGGRTTYTLATTGAVPAQLRAALDAAGGAADFDVHYLAMGSDDAVRQAVRDGEATAGLADGRLYTPSSGSGTFPVVVAQTALVLETSRRLTEAGLTAQQIAQLQSIRPPEQVVVGRVQDEGRAAVGFAVGIILFMALTFAGQAIAGTVATEKSARVSEVLLAVLRPSQVLVGTVLAVGAAALAQLLVLAAPLAVAVRFTDTIGLPSVASADIVLAVAWFLLGFLLFSFLFGATAALVDKVAEVGAAILPVTMTLVAGYLLAVTVAVRDPLGGVTVVASIFPLTAPLVMPVRWASGEVPVHQLVLAMSLTASSSVLLVWLGSSIYGRALVITGRRVRLREVLRGRSTP